MAALSNGLSQGGTTAELGPFESWTDVQLIDELCHFDSELNEWERGFVTDIIKRVLVYKHKMSSAMREKAEETVEKYQ